ncbi:uncharacterized protein LTR77_004267 [Saxophila tyrrhenica]|uniref:Uncharacterized protein n=1 Tax=Saxophila tyrrhenica TaxID=1690608 RepID=A0AAV9PD30_9PEZI|nr:hypothetical protein LTR77_004267 [Saxophila tyrrhenica]
MSRSVRSTPLRTRSTTYAAPGRAVEPEANVEVASRRTGTVDLHRREVVDVVKKLSVDLEIVSRKVQSMHDDMVNFKFVAADMRASENMSNPDDPPNKLMDLIYGISKACGVDLCKLIEAFDTSHDLPRPRRLLASAAARR